MKPVRKSTGGINDKNQRRWSGTGSGTGKSSSSSSLAAAPSSAPPNRRQPTSKGSSATPPTTIELRGIPIHFPFQPYKCQEDYMTVVLDALLRKENALLESPTGTGKTLCLLCACLAWQREQSRILQSRADVSGATTTELQASSKVQNKRFGPVPTIIYASRTHSQLSQVVRELRNTRYRPRHAVLGSREQMCVNPKVKKATSTASTINHDCSALNKERRCQFKNRLEGFSAPSNESSNGQWFGTQPVMDMEDLVLMGQNHKVCPFYYTRDLVEDAELVLVPYNYLFDKDARGSTLSDIPWDNAVVIFDEAHNLESFATESASFDLSSKDIGGCMNEVDKAITYIEADPDRFGGYIKRDNLLRLKSVFMNLEEYIMTKLPLNPSAYRGEKMMDIFDKGAKINFTTYDLVLDLIRKLMDVFMEIRGGASKGAPHLEHFMQCLKRVFGEASEVRCLAKAESYRVHVSPPQSNASSGGRGGRNDGSVGRTVSYWCFAPSEAMRELQELRVRSILVTSGTLSPLESYALELDLPFPHRLENPHIISPEQIHVRVIGKGVKGKLLNSSYERRQDAEYYIELGDTLASLSRIIPGGMLIFFPSYGVMETAIERWGGPASARGGNQNKGVHNFFSKRQRKPTGSGKNSARYSFPQQADYFSSGDDPAWKRLLGHKAVVIEPRLSSDLPDAIEEFHKYLNMPKSKGVALFGVCRGKISEGIDFAHAMCRAVIITGLPFAPSFDPKVKMKREFLDHNRAKHNATIKEEGGFGNKKKSINAGLSGHDWYQQQAHRAVNQAVGRVIRNKRDYGAVLLMDSRFSFPGNQNGLSKWVRPHILPDNGYGKVAPGLVRFYKMAKELEAQLMKEAPPPEKPTRVARMLEYENEGKENNGSDAMADETENTKVAFIDRRVSAPKGTAEENSNSESQSSPSKSYIPQQNIIATVDVSTNEGSKKASEMMKKNSHEKNELSSLSMSSTENSMPITEKSASKVIRTADTSVSPAKHFFQTVQKTMSEKEVATIKKAVVQMKKHSQLKYQNEFLAAAKKVIEIILKYDKFLNRSKARKPELLVLLLQLLPKHFLKALTDLTIELVFRETELCNELRAAMPKDRYAQIHVAFVSFMTELWFGEDNANERDVTTKVSCFLVAMKEKKGLPVSALSRVTMVVPREVQRVTDALVSQFVTVTPAFKSTTMGKRITMPAARPTPTPTASSHSQAPKATLKPNPYNPYSRASTSNPSSQTPNTAKKRALEQEGTVDSARSSFSLKKLVKQSSSEIYTGTPNNKTASGFKSNAPTDLTCSICDRLMPQPYIAECGHMACKPCWVAWLRKTGNCAHCRKPTSVESLALAVFKDS
ncbi:MAG: hypothetical protein SGILL_002492 [Bacillariaceae sp.]